MSSVATLLEEAEAHVVRGWDFSWLGDRLTTAPLPWSFSDIVTRHARLSPDLLDVGTGGGEWLAVLPDRPPRTVATESWPANVDVAGERLRPLGITVVWDDPAPDNVDQLPHETRARLPFPSQSFALVSNRHTSFVASEVARVLTVDGAFLTEQVGGVYDDFYAALELPPPPPPRTWDLEFARAQLEAAGLHVVESAVGQEVTTFADAGAFAWYLKAVPWSVEGFSISAYRPHLERLQERIARGGPIAIEQPAFWLAAVKSGAVAA